VTGEFGIVKEPEIKFSSNGKAWLTIRCVAKERKLQGNQWVDGNVTFIDVVAFDKQAENLVESVSKGDTIMVTGKLVQREWEDNEGNKRSTMQINADQLAVSLRWGPAKAGQMLGSSNTIASVKEALGAEELEEVPF
jgi:single-strand DNA-binding protein